MSRTAVARSLLGALLAVSCLGWPGIGRAAIELNVGLSGSPGTTTSPVVVVERVELSFPNRRPSQTVNRDETGFYAEARFVYKGNGPLTIRWLVDGRVLVQQTEMLTFGQTLLVRSNANGIDLPTFQPGIHRVTLELVNDTASGGGLSIPTISYLVADGAGPSGVPLALELARPAGTSTFDAATGDFRWNASKGFSVFRVEVERQSSSRAGGYRSVLAADVPGTSYAPPATDRQRFTAGPHRWRVTGFPADSSRPPVRTPWRSFFVRGGVAKGGVFLSRAALAGSAVPAGNGRVTDTLQASRALKSRGVLAPGQNYLNLRLENSGVMRQGGLAVEVYRDGTLVSRNNLAELSAGRFMDLAVPVDIPLRESAGTFSVRIVRAGGQLDEAEVEFVNPFAFQMGRIDFTERAEPVDPSFGFDPGFSGCGGALGAPLATDDDSLVFARVVSATTLDGETQDLTQRPYFTFDRGQRVAFGAWVEDRGLVDFYRQGFIACRDQAIAQLGLTLDEFEQNQAQVAQCAAGGAVSPGSPAPGANTRMKAGRGGFMKGGALDRVTTPGMGMQDCLPSGTGVGGSPGGSPGMDAMGAGPGECLPQDVGGGVDVGAGPPPGPDGGGAGGGPDICAGLVDQGAQVAAAMGGVDTAVTIPTGAPLSFRVYAYREDGSLDPTPVWESPVILPKDARQVLHSGVVADPDSGWWEVPATGRYRVTLHDIGEDATVYGTLPGGLPTHIRMAGFELQVTGYEDPVEGEVVPVASLPEGGLAAGVGLSGEAVTTWRGDSAGNAIGIRFDNLTLSDDGDPLHRVADGGVAYLRPATRHTLDMGGYLFQLQALRLDMSGAYADLGYALPGFLSGPDAVSISGVNPDVARKALGTPSPKAPVHSAGAASGPGAAPSLFLKPAGPSVVFVDTTVMNGGEFIAKYAFDDSWGDTALEGGELALRLNGARLIADMSPHLGYSEYTDNPALMGVGLADAVVRARVTPPPHNGTAVATSHLFPAANGDAAFLYGKTRWASLLNDGLLSQNLEVLPPGSVAPFFGEEADETIQLLAPLGFGLRITGGRFGVMGGAVAGVDLSGHLVLPERYGTVEMPFDSLTRAPGLTGFTTHVVTQGLPTVQIGAFSYLPEQAEFRFPARLPIPSAGVSPVLSLPDLLMIPPTSPDGLAGWQAWVADGMAGEAGLHLTGGRITLPWEKTAAPRGPPPASGTPGAMGMIDAVGVAGRGVVDLAETLVEQGGAFLLDAGGVRGQWLRLNDPSYRKVGAFAGKVAFAHMAFADGVMVDSQVRGSLTVPYPAWLTVDFQGTLTEDGQILVAEDGLVPPPMADGWQLDYWGMTLFPSDEPQPGGAPATTGIGAVGRSGAGRLTAGAAGARPSVQARLPLLFGGSFIRVRQAEMELDVTEEFGGREFTRDGGGHPFAVTLDLFPSGNIGYDGDEGARPPVTPLGALRFLGVPFTPSGEIKVVPYVSVVAFNGDSPVAAEATGFVTGSPDETQVLGLAVDATPEPGVARLDTSPRIQVEGEVRFGFLGTRKLRINHTPSGARVPFISQPTMSCLEVLTQAGTSPPAWMRIPSLDPGMSAGGDAAGPADDLPPQVVCGDARGNIRIAAELRFENTYGRQQMDTVLAGAIESTQWIPEGGALSGQEHFKMFLGKGDVRILNTVSLTSLVEAGQVGDGTYVEKFTVGQGVHLFRAVLAGINPARTIGKLGAAGGDIAFGLPEFGEDVAYLVGDVVGYVMTLAEMAVTDVCEAAGTGGGAVTVETGVGAAAGAAADAACGPFWEEFTRMAVSDGLQLLGSAFHLTRSAVEELVRQGHISEAEALWWLIGLDLSGSLAKGAGQLANFDKMSPEQIIVTLLGVADSSLAAIATTYNENPAVSIPVRMTRLPVQVGRPLLERGNLTKDEIFDLVENTAALGEDVSWLPPVRAEAPLLPFAMTVAHRSVSVARDFSGGRADPVKVLGLTSSILNLFCEVGAENRELADKLVASVAEATGMPEGDFRNIFSLSRTTFNGAETLAGSPNATDLINAFLLPLLRDLVEGGDGGFCTSMPRFDPYDAEVKALLSVSVQTLDGVNRVPQGVQSSLVWGMDTVISVLEATETLTSSQAVQGLVQTAADEAGVSLPAGGPPPLDDRVIPTLEAVRDAVAGIDTGDAPYLMALKFSDAVAPIVETRLEDPELNVPALVHEHVDVVRELLHGLVPLVEGGYDEPVVWIDGAIPTLSEMGDLPLGDPVKAGLSIAVEALTLARGPAAGEALEAAQLIAGAKRILGLVIANFGDTLGQTVVAGGRPPAPLLLAYNGPVMELARFVPAAGVTEPRVALEIALGMLDLLAYVIDHGTLDAGGLMRFLDVAASAMSGTAGAQPTAVGPGGRALHVAAGRGGIGPTLAATALAVPVLFAADANIPEAYRRALLRLLEHAEELASTPAVRRAVADARLVLLRDPDLVVGTHVARATDGTLLAVRQVAVDGVVRTLDPELGLLTENYPEGHPAHPGGLEQSVLISPLPTDEALLLNLEAPQWAPLIAEGTVLARAYRDPSDNYVVYSLTNAGVDGAVRIEGPASEGFAPVRLLSVAEAPPSGRAADQINGTLLTDTWRQVEPDGTTYTYEYIQGQPFMGRKSADGRVLELRALSDAAVFSDRGAVLQAFHAGHLVEYHGPAMAQDGPNPPPAQAGNLMVHYTFGDTALYYQRGSSQDLLEIDPDLVLQSPSDIPATGALRERFQIAPDGTTWLYQPGIKALHTTPSGAWELYEMEALPAGTLVPHPTGTITPGPLVAACCNDQGDVTGPDGQPLNPGQPGSGATLRDGTLTLEGPDGQPRLAVGPDGSVSLPAGHGVTITPVGGGSVVEWQDEGGSHRVETTADGTVQSFVTAPDGTITHTTGVEEAAGERVVTVTRPDGSETVTLARCENGGPVAQCPAEQTITYTYAYSTADPLVFYPGDAPPLLMPEGNDPLVLEKRAFVTLVNTARAQMEASPSEDGVGQLWDLLSQAMERGWEIPGLVAAVNRSQAVILSALAGEALSALKARAGDAAVVGAWLSDLGAPDNPLGRLRTLLATAEALGLEHSNRVDALLGQVLRRAYLALEQQLLAVQPALGPIPEQTLGAVIRPVLNLWAFIASDAVDEAAVFGVGQTADMAHARLCQAIPQVASAFQNRIADPGYVLIGQDLRTWMDIAATDQLLDCDSLAQSLKTTVTAGILARAELLALTPSGKMMLEEMTGRPAPGMLSVHTSTTDIADRIERDGAAGIDFAVQIFQEAANRQMPADNEAKLRELVRHVHRIRRIQQLIEGIAQGPGAPPGMDPQALQPVREQILAAIVDGWNGQNTTAMATFAETAPIGLPDGARVRQVLELVALAGELNELLGAEVVSTAAVREQLAQALLERLDAILEAVTVDTLHGFSPEGGIENGPVPSIVTRLEDMDAIALVVNQAWPGAALPTARERLDARLPGLMAAAASALAEVDQNAAASAYGPDGLQPAIRAAIAPLAPLPDLIDWLEAAPARQAFIDGVDRINQQAVERATADPAHWQVSLQIILEVRAAAEVLGWTIGGASLAVTPETEAILTVAYDDAWNRLLASRSTEAMQRFLDVVAVAGMMGMDMDPRVEETGQILDELSLANAMCLYPDLNPDVPACSQAQLVMAADLAALAQAIGYSQADQLVQDLETMLANGNVANSGTLVDLTDFSLEMVERDNAGRARVATLLQGLVDQLNVAEEADRTTLRLLRDRARSWAGLAVSYAVASPDPLIQVAEQVDATIAAWSQAQLEDLVLIPTTLPGAPEATSFAPVDLGPLEQFVNAEPEILIPDMDSLPLITREILAEAGAQDRYQAVASLLRAVLDDPGLPAAAVLAYRLSDSLPDPADVAPGAIRFGMIPQLAQFLVLGSGVAGSPAPTGVGFFGPGAAGACPEGGVSVADPVALVQGVICIAVSGPQDSPGLKAAEITRQLLLGLGAPSDPIVELGLKVTAAAVDAGIETFKANPSGGAVDAIILSALNQFSAQLVSAYPLESVAMDEFWLGASGRVLKLGLDVYVEHLAAVDDAFVGTGLAVGAAVLGREEFSGAMSGIPYAPFLTNYLRHAMMDTAGFMSGDHPERPGAPSDWWPIAVARVSAHAVFDNAPEVRLGGAHLSQVLPLGRDLTDWSLDLVNVNRGLLSSQSVEDLSGNMLRALTTSGGVPTLTCLMNSHLGLAVPPELALTPMIGAAELWDNRALLSASAQKDQVQALVSAGAGMLAVWTRPGGLMDCASPVGATVGPPGDSAFSAIVRSLVTTESDVELLGVTLVQAVRAAESLRCPSAEARAQGDLRCDEGIADALEVLWNGPASAPDAGLAEVMQGTADYLEFGMTAPTTMAQVYAALSRKLEADPATRRLLHLLEGACESENLLVLAPDVCTDRFADMMLAVLEDVRMALVWMADPNESGKTLEQSRADQIALAADPSADPSWPWHWLATVPVTEDPGTGPFADAARGYLVPDPDKEMPAYDAVSRLAAAAQLPQAVGAIDLARWVIMLLGSLPPAPEYVNPGEMILAESPLGAASVGGEGFSGWSGGYVGQTRPNGTTENALILLGNLEFPILGAAAAQVMYNHVETPQGDVPLSAAVGPEGNYPVPAPGASEQYVRIRAGAGFPETETIGAMFGDLGGYATNLFAGLASSQFEFDAKLGPGVNELTAYTRTQLWNFDLATAVLRGSINLDRESSEFLTGNLCLAQQAAYPIIGVPVSIGPTVGAQGQYWNTLTDRGLALVTKQGLQVAVPGIDIELAGISGWTAHHEGDWSPLAPVAGVGVDACAKVSFNGNFLGYEFDYGPEFEVQFSDSGIKLRHRLELPGGVTQTLWMYIDAQGVYLPRVNALEASAATVEAAADVFSSVLSGDGVEAPDLPAMRFPEEGDEVNFHAFTSVGGLKATPEKVSVDGWGGWDSSVPFGGACPIDLSCGWVGEGP